MGIFLWVILNQLFALLSGINELSVEPYDEDEGTGDLRYVQVTKAITFTDLGVKKNNILI